MVTQEVTFGEVVKINEALRQKVAELEAKILDLEELLRKNSKNSSFPPSRDYKKTKRTKKPSGKKRGAQPGHVGKTRALYPEEKISEVIECPPGQCECGGAQEPLSGYKRHQVVDLPQEIPVEITEYRRHKCRCKACGKVTVASLPQGAPKGAFGPKLIALMSVLATQYRMSRRQVRSLVNTILEIPISLGSVSEQEAHVERALSESYSTLCEASKSSAVKHCDETRYRQQQKSGYAWVLVTVSSVLFFLRHSRGSNVAKEVLGTSGTIVTDRFSSYQWIDPSSRQVCWAHLLRDFTQISERQGEAGRLGKILVSTTNDLFTYWHHHKEQELLSFKEFQEKMAPLQQLIEKSLEQGLVCGHLRTERTCHKVLSLRESLWTFVEDQRVDPTNNAAERALRPLVIHRKLSFGTQSQRGTRFIECLFSILATLTLQGLCPWKHIESRVRASFA